MLRDFLRTIGAACIIAGTALYFISTPDVNAKDDLNQDGLQEEIVVLQEALNRTEEELANLQLVTSAAEEPLNEDKANNIEEANNQDSAATSLIKTLLRVEPGATSSSISYELERSGIIEHATEFDDYLATNKLSAKIQIGEYDLDSSMSINEIAEIITNAN